jgi:UDP-4-amino-4-deoxy-L-arabinose formyltransferase/UDP-glucuronic acid dehydrogenase (UDP-4-keto-hexauronic acid decarboxylating)
MVRAVFFGSSDSVFSNRHFHELLRSGCGVVGVVDVPPARRTSTNETALQGESFIAAARRLGIPDFEPANPNDPLFIEEIRALMPDMFTAVGYMLLLKGPLLAVPRVIAANFHASLLPAYRGKHPVFWALRHGESWSGLTVHEMGPGLDTGDIIFQVKVRTRETDSVADLYERIMRESVPLVPRLVACVSEGNVPRTPQRTQGGSYFGATVPADFRMDWRRDARVLARWITATPGKCFAAIGGHRLYILDGCASAGAGNARPGTLARMDREACLITAGDGAVCINRVRTADGKEMSAREALREIGIVQGSTLDADGQRGGD